MRGVELAVLADDDEAGGADLVLFLVHSAPARRADNERSEHRRRERKHEHE